jgi:hypothetical protein
VVSGAALLIDEIGSIVDGVQAIETDASLEAAAGLPPQEPNHLDLTHQVVRALVDMSEAIYPPSAEVRRGGGQFLIARVMGQVVGHGGRVDVRSSEGMVYDVIDPGSEGEDVALQPA